MKDLFSKKWFKIGGAIVLVALLALLLFFFLGRNSGGASYDENAIYGTKVSDLNYASSMQSGGSRFSGVVESQQSIQYKKDGERKIEEIYVKVGDSVKKGSKLFKFDVREAENSIAQAQLDIEGYQQEINIYAYDNSKEGQLAVKQANVEIKKLQNDIAGYQQEIDNAVVTSEIDGIVKAVSETGTDAQGQDAAVVEVMEVGEYRVKGKIDEQQIYSLAVGDEMRIISRTNESQTWTGVVQKVDTEPVSDNNNEFGGDAEGERASSYNFYVTLDDTEGLMLGQHVYIEASNGANLELTGIWLPEDFIVMDENGAYAYVGENGKLKKRKIEVGETNEDLYMIEIVDGLTDDDLLVFPDETLEEGMPVIDMAEVAE